MRLYLDENVLDAARRRIGWVFDEFDNVVVNVSGGKDSTVCFYLAMEAARERNRLPLRVYWLDQEAEWGSTVDICRSWFYRDDVDPLWLQVPFRIFNATSSTDYWLRAWDPEEQEHWVHPQDPLARHENVYGTDRFAELFGAVVGHEYPQEQVARIAGVRAEESPARRFGLTAYETYKGETWGVVDDKNRGHYTFYPIYDWATSDVWKAIGDHGWAYNKLYDWQHRFGIPTQHMRVSDLHHETAIRSLFYLHEIEPETYDKLIVRLKGVDAAARFGFRDYFPEKLPFMFNDWREYRDYLLEHLIDVPEWREKMRRRFESGERRWDPVLHQKLWQMHVRSILVSDWEGILCNNFDTGQPRHLRKSFQKRLADSEAETAG